MTVFQYRTMEEIFDLEDFPFDEQTVELAIRLPKSNAKDGHFALCISDELDIPKERIRPKEASGAISTAARDGTVGQGALEMTYSVQSILLQQWTILNSGLVPARSDRVVLTLQLRRKQMISPPEIP